MFIVERETADRNFAMAYYMRVINLKIYHFLKILAFYTLQLGQLIMYYTHKKVLPFAVFFTYQAFKNREGVVSQTNLVI